MEGKFSSSEERLQNFIHGDLEEGVFEKEKENEENKIEEGFVVIEKDDAPNEMEIQLGKYQEMWLRKRSADIQNRDCWFEQMFGVSPSHLPNVTSHFFEYRVALADLFGFFIFRFSFLLFRLRFSEKNYLYSINSKIKIDPLKQPLPSHQIKMERRDQPAALPSPSSAPPIPTRNFSSPSFIPPLPSPRSGPFPPPESPSLSSSSSSYKSTPMLPKPARLSEVMKEKLRKIFQLEVLYSVVFLFIPGLYSGKMPGSADAPDHFKDWFQQVFFTFVLLICFFIFIFLFCFFILFFYFHFSFFFLIV